MFFPATFVREKSPMLPVVPSSDETADDELRRMAAGYLQHDRPGHTLQPAALVREAGLRLPGQRRDRRNRAHFLAVAA